MNFSNTFIKHSLMALSAVSLLAATNLEAAAFRANTETPISLGQGHAGAGAGNGYAESQFHNPASLRNLTKQQLQFGANVISSKFKPDNASGTTLLSTPVVGESDPGNATSAKVLPNFFIAGHIDDQTSLGLAVTTPWGLVTDYDESWSGRYQASTSQINSINITPSIAYNITPKLAIGAGVQAQYLDARLTNAVDCGTIDTANFFGALGLTPGTDSSDCSADVQGDDWAFGFNIGVNYTPVKGTRLGLAYRSKIDHDIDGDVEYGYSNPALAAALPNGGIRANLKTPAVLTAGISQDITEKLNLGFDVHWTQWSSFDSLGINFNSGQAKVTEDNQWHDTIMVAAGGSYDVTSKWTVRSGLTFDQSPIKDSLRNARLPGADRYWFNIGSSYDITNALAIHGTYTYSMIDDENSVNVSNANGGFTTEYDDPYFQVFALQASVSF